MKKISLQKELDKLIIKENKFIKRYENKKNINQSLINKKLDKVLPNNLKETLNKAFLKAFELVFEKGINIIEKTYDKEAYMKSFEINMYSKEVFGDRKRIRAFNKRASNSLNKNILIAGAEGIGFGLLGVGIPDILVLTGMLLKGIYEISLSFGFSYDSNEEKYFILKLIETSVSSGEILSDNNLVLDKLITRLIHMSSDITDNISIAKGDLEQQLELTSKALSEELLYMKFIQGIPIVGIAGGISDCIYMKRINEFAKLKYYKRFLRNEIIRSN